LQGGKRERSASPSLFLVFCFHGDRYSSADGKFRRHFAPAGSQQRDQVIQNHIGYVLVKDPLIAESPEVKFERFGFEDLLIGLVLKG
jgi:hypothetical protein